MEILNQPRSHKRALRFCPNGEINIRKRVIDLLDLSSGDSVVFLRGDDGRMYIYKDNSDPLALVLHGRKGQVSCQSVATVAVILSCVEGLTAEMRKAPVELVAFNRRCSVTVGGRRFDAVNIINRI